MMHDDLENEDALKRTAIIFEERILKYRSDRLFVTPFSRNMSLRLHDMALWELDDALKKLM